jgi:hypothetical protein
MKIDRQTAPRTRVEGSTLIEACLVVMLLSLILFGGVQISRLFAAKEIIDYSAMAGARAKAVGLNNFMVYKVARIASIPNAGRLSNPQVDSAAGQAQNWTAARPGYLWDTAVASDAPYSPQYGVEISRIPFYLGADNYGQLGAILNYEDWNTVNIGQDLSEAGEQVLVNVSQRVPLDFPFRRAFYDGDDVNLRAGSRFNRGVRMANHAELYLEGY